MDRLRKRIDRSRTSSPTRRSTRRTRSAATQLAKERSDLGSQLARHEEKWLEMSSEYEAATAE